MSGVLVKICGLSTPDTVAAAVEAGADWLGFVLVPVSPRFVTAEAAAVLAAPVRGRAKVAVLLVAPDDDAVDAALAAVRPDAVQLHGSETPERVAALKARIAQAEVWKALPVETAGDLDAAAAYGVADRLLLDAKPPAGADRTGGHGAAFDWSLLADRSLDRPWFLAGGLTPANVAAALHTTGAVAADVSSGVERERGVKDAALVRRFVQAVRNAKL